MTMMVRIVAAALAMLLVGDDPAQAFFLVPFVAAALAISTFAATVVVGVATIAASFGLSYVANKLFAAKPKPGTPDATVSGLQLDVRIDGELPQSLIVGRAITAGSLVYARTFGERGDIDNAYLVEIRPLADHPCNALIGAFVEGQPVTLATHSNPAVGLAPVEYGELLGLKFYNGSQTTADSIATDAFSASTDQPWTANHIGRGVTYVRTLSIYDQNRVPGQLRWKFIVDGIRLYDPRKDSSVSGGSGAHRYTTLSTHEWTDNLAVIAYNILRGIYVANAAGTRQFFYGIEGTAADQLPLDVWFAAMNECDVLIDLDVGGTEKQFRAGGEITVDREPRDVIKELLDACGGTFVEIGGIYKIYLGAPGLPIASVTDDALLANREAHFKPVLGLQQRINYVTGSYTSPDDGWIAKVAPPRENTTWRTEDGRRLPASLDAPMVQSGTQFQRLQTQLLNRSRQQRKHLLTFPPSLFYVEPGDTLEWSSTDNGYIDKLFQIDDVEYESNCTITAAVTEVDPADYDWSPSFELPEVDGALVTLLPAAKVIVGFDAQGIVLDGDDGTQRAAIKLTWTPPTDGDISGVAWQLRTAADITNVAPGSTNDREDVVAGAIIIAAGGLQPRTNYQIRARFISFNGYGADWSLWIDVTTPDVSVSLADFERGLRDYVSTQIKSVDERFTKFQQWIANYAANQDSQQWTDKQQVRTDLVSREGVLSTSITEVKTIAHNAELALASLETTVAATFSDHDARIVTNATAIAATNFAFASLSSTVTASIGGLTASVAQNTTAVVDINGRLGAQWTVTLDANNYISGITAFNDGSFSAFRIIADAFQVAFPGQSGGDPITMFQIGNVNGVAKIVFRGDMYADGDISARSLAAGSVTAGKIAAGAVYTESIIGNNVVITGHLRADAATSVAVATGASVGASRSPGQPGFSQDLISMSFDVQVGKLIIDVMFEVTGNFIQAPSQFSIDVLVDGIQVKRSNYAAQLRAGFINTDDAFQGLWAFINTTSIATYTNAPIGVRVITVRLNVGPGSSIPGDNIIYTILSPFLRVMESRR